LPCFAYYADCAPLRCHAAHAATLRLPSILISLSFIIDIFISTLMIFAFAIYFDSHIAFAARRRFAIAASRIMFCRAAAAAMLPSPFPPRFAIRLIFAIFTIFISPAID
jgi:hypothetical protein